MRFLLSNNWLGYALIVTLCANLLAESGGINVRQEAIDELMQVEQKFKGEAPSQGTSTLIKIPGGLRKGQNTGAQTDAATRRALSQAVTQRLRSLKGETPETKFSQLAQLFKDSEKPSPLLFKADSVALGKCVSRFEPDTFTPGYVNIYVEADELLGKQVYFVPQIETQDRQVASLEHLTSKEHQVRHQQRSQIRKQFTSLQSNYPKNIPLMDLLKTKLEKAFFFSYTPQTQDGGESGGVYYRLRGGSDRGKNFLILQRLCPYYPGCQSQGSTVVDYLNYVDAFAFCYYTKTVKFKRDMDLIR